MDISLDGFAEMIGQVRFGETGYLMVVEDSGTVLVDPRVPSHNFKPLKEIGDGYRELAELAMARARSTSTARATTASSIRRRTWAGNTSA